MKHVIAVTTLKVNGDDINVGYMLEDGNYITTGGYEYGVKEFLYSNDLKRIEERQFVGEFVDFKATKHVDKKWINELTRQGYKTYKLINVES